MAKKKKPPAATSGKQSGTNGKYQRPHSIPRDYATINIDIDDLLRNVPLPPSLQQFEPLFRSPAGESLLKTAMTCLHAGLSQHDTDAALQQVIQFYKSEYHRCNACHSWSKVFYAGGIVTDGRFVLSVVCQSCADRVAAGRASQPMKRNMRTHVLGGVE
jgi:hypothetical protein